MLGMRHQRPPVSRCSSLCYLYKESRDTVGLAILPYHLLSGHMGWGYRKECLLGGEKKKILVDLCASCSLRLDLLSSHIYTASQKFLNSCSFLCMV